MPDGEKQKNTLTLNKIHHFLIKKKFDRQVTIVAFGGGVIGDLAGFASDTFLRGVDFPKLPPSKKKKNCYIAHFLEFLPK